MSVCHNLYNCVFLLGVVAITIAVTSVCVCVIKASNPHITSGWMVKWNKKKKGVCVGGTWAFTEEPEWKPAEELNLKRLYPSVNFLFDSQAEIKKQTNNLHSHLSLNLHLSGLKVLQRDTCRQTHTFSDNISNQHSVIIWACACVWVTEWWKGREGGLTLNYTWGNFVEMMFSVLITLMHQTQTLFLNNHLICMDPFCRTKKK